MPFFEPSASRRSWPENDAHVLHRVMLIDVQVAARLEIQVEAAVPGEKLQHVIEKANAGRDLVSAAAVQIQAPADIGLGGLAMQGCAMRAFMQTILWKSRRPCFSKLRPPLRVWMRSCRR